MAGLPLFTRMRPARPQAPGPLSRPDGAKLSTPFAARLAAVSRRYNGVMHPEAISSHTQAPAAGRRPERARGGAA